MERIELFIVQPSNSKEKLINLNQEMQELLKLVSSGGETMLSSLLIRKSMLDWTWPAEGVPPETIMMYVSDQLSFYKILLTEMMAFFTGNDRGQCVSFNLTVAELLFLIRLLLEEQVMNTQALKPIFLFLSRYVSTSSAEQLSYESLRKKYSANNSIARENVHKLLMKLVARIDQYYSDK